MKVKHEICAMQILLIAATEQEIQPFAANNTGVDIIDHRSWYAFSYISSAKKNKPGGI